MRWFITNDKTLNNIINYLYNNKNSFIERRLIEEYDLTIRGYKNDDLLINALQRFGIILRKLNLKQTSIRYKGNIPYKNNKYKFKWLKKVNIYQALKSLQCLIYQCTEGNYKEEIMYKILKDMEHSLMDDIIEKIPEYSLAKWD